MMKNNLRLVTRAFDGFQKDVGRSSEMARNEMMTALIQLSKEQIKGKRQPGEKAWKGSPEPPMNRTGKLRQSIKGFKYQSGFASYSAIIGPTIEYGRHVELGGPNWPMGVKFPYMEPAYAQFRSQIFPQIQAKYFRRFAK